MTEENMTLVKRFLQNREAAGYKDKAGTRYKIKKYMEYLEETGLQPEEVHYREAGDYQGRLLAEDSYTIGTINNFINIVISFYDFLINQNLALNNPFTDIERIKNDKKLPKNILSEVQMNSLLDDFRNFVAGKNLKEKKSKYKLHVLAEVLYSTGLRIHEAAALRVEDIDLNQGIIKVKKTKGDKARTVILNEYVKEVLSLYIKRMRELILNKNSNRDRFFGAETTVLERQVNRELKRITGRFKYPAMTSHGFRHALGFHLLRAGCNIRYIQQMLGHKRIKNTEIYTKVDRDSLKSVLDSYHPRQEVSDG